MQEAALALYSEREFDQTTAAQIAARAGLTERTFFRHFADKGEVLFGGSALLQERIVAGVAGAPPEDGALEAVAAGLAAAAAMLGEFRRDLSRQRTTSSPPTPSCVSGSWRNWPSMPPRSAKALHHRGVGEPQAELGGRGWHDDIARRHRAVVERGRRPGPRRRHAGLHGGLRAVAGGG